MHLLGVDKLKVGQVLGRSIYNEKRELMLAAGYKLDPQILAMLRRAGFTYVYVLDGVADEILPEVVISDTLRASSNITVATALDNVRENASLRSLKPENIETKLRDDKKFANAINVSEVQKMALGMIEEIMENHVCLFAALPIRSNLSKAIDHSVDVALLSILMGRILELSNDDLFTLATSAMLHDVGKAIMHDSAQKEIDAGKDPKEAFKEHPTYSMLLLKGSDPSSFKEQYTIHHHHEQIDGTGYPQRIRGDDLPPLKKITTENDSIFRLSTVLAVANHYDNLISGSHYSIKMTPEEALSSVIMGAGTKWNSYSVRALVQVVQLFPVGTRVRIIKTDSNDYAGYYGVVIRNNDYDPLRPIVILTHNSMNGEVSPKQVNFFGDRKIKLEIVL